MRKIWFTKYTLQFKFDAGTSRGVMRTRDSWFIFIQTEDGKIGIGECAPLPGLSNDPIDIIENELQRLCNRANQDQSIEIPKSFPSIKFGFEMAELDLNSGGQRLPFPSDFTEKNAAIPINGLVWMGDFEFMKKQIKEKIEAGYSCIKLKIGAIDFEQELELIRMIRQEYTVADIEIRVDANGAFKTNEAAEKLKRLSEYDLHSIEQPIRQNQWEHMAELCEKTPLPIALDEELIGVQDHQQKQELISIIKPQYIILKPSLLGGFSASEEWIKLANDFGIGWWVTSALESNIGLNAIAQWTYTLKNTLPQGLGTGQLYTNNFDSPLLIQNGSLFYQSQKNWNLERIL